jgi:predicted nucleic acid-binding protein
MDGKVFFDTTILLYLYAADKPKKQATSIKVVQECKVKPTISTQTLSELANTLARNMQLQWYMIDQVLTEIEQAFTVELITVPMIHKACSLAENYHYSYYNSIAVATALLSGCTVFLTEQLEHELLIEEQLHIRNPFQAH